MLSAPFMGLIRDALFSRFAGAAVRGVALAFVALAAAAFFWAVLRIRYRRWPRYGALALAATLLALQEWLTSADIADVSFAAQVNVAEKIHLIEYGLLAFLLYRAFRSAGDFSLVLMPLLCLIPAGVLEEGIQFLVETRLGELRDVLLNLYAGVCGVLFGLAFDPPESFRWSLTGRWRGLYDAAALAVLALGSFFYFAHLGYEHMDPEIGRFRSWHTLEELREAATDRAVKWRTEPPTELSPWRREDFYLTEAGWHTNHRNERHNAGDHYLALQANRILEKYYDPFLDLESIRYSGRHRYPPDQRQALEASAPKRDPAAYLSPVLVNRIYPWPSKRLFLTIWIPMVLALWLLPRIFRRR
ncbi:MAG: hypothetical protein GY719_19230 [bacterium]|nr:hypothetical protein [bacterium]